MRNVSIEMVGIFADMLRRAPIPNTEHGQSQMLKVASFSQKYLPYITAGILVVGASVIAGAVIRYHSENNV